MEVQMAGGRVRTLEAPPGCAVSRTRVLTDDPPGGRARLVGTIDGPARIDAWADPTRPQLVETIDLAGSAGALVRVRLPDGRAVAMVPPSGIRPSPGDRFAVVPVRADAGATSHVTAVSSALP
jgi:hypothetical protein